MAAACVERTAATLLRGLQKCCIRSKIFRAAFLFNPLMLDAGFKRKVETIRECLPDKSAFFS